METKSPEDASPSISLETLIETRKRLEMTKHELKQQLAKIERKQKINEKAIRDTCQHNWVRDTAYYGPYDKPDDTCTICGTINYRF